MSDHPQTVDVSELPDFAFDHRDPMWWGSATFIAIEGTSLAAAVTSYFYLSRNVEAWPPPPTPLPTLWPAIVAMIFALVTAVPAYLAARAAPRMDGDTVRRWLVLQAVGGVLLMLLRIPELLALNTRWDSHAYGSIVWSTVVLHIFVALTDLADTIGLATLFVLRREENKHFPAIRDNSMYWYFIVLSWIIVDLVIFVGPRVL
jgi:heme/copper-type cytochrome/quinol oxidase subunit 3